MKIFTGTETYPVKEGSTDPGICGTLIYFLGDISDQWPNFVHISYTRVAYIRMATRFGDVKGL